MFYVILIIFTLYSATLHGTRPIIALFANMQGASPFIIGLLVSCYAILPMLLAVRIGKWLDLYGARLMLTAGSCGFMASLLLPILYPTVAVLFFTQPLTGISQLFILLAFQKTVGNWPGHRDKLVATFTLTSSLGELLGPLVSGFTYEHYGFRVVLGVFFTLISLGLLSSLSIKSSYWKSGASSSEKNQAKDSPWKMLKQANLRNALIISGLVLYSKDLNVAFFPVYANSIGFSPGTIGILLSIMGGMSMMVRLCQFQLVRAFGRDMVLTTTLVASGICYLLITNTSNFILLAVLTGLLGAGLGLGQPLSLVYALNLTPQERHGEVLGIRLTFNRASQFLAPFLMGGFGGIAGVIPIFWVTGGVLLLGAYFTRIKTGSTPKVPESM